MLYFLEEENMINSIEKDDDNSLLIYRKYFIQNLIIKERYYNLALKIKVTDNLIGLDLIMMNL